MVYLISKLSGITLIERAGGTEYTCVCVRFLVLSVKNIPLPPNFYRMIYSLIYLGIIISYKVQKKNNIPPLCQ